MAERSQSPTRRDSGAVEGQTLLLVFRFLRHARADRGTPGQMEPTDPCSRAFSLARLVIRT